MNSSSASLAANKDFDAVRVSFIHSLNIFRTGKVPSVLAHKGLLLKDLNGCSAFSETHCGRRCGFVIRV